MPAADKRSEDPGTSIDRLALVKQAIDANCGIAQSVGSLRRRE